MMYLTVYICALLTANNPYEVTKSAGYRVLIADTNNSNNGSSFVDCEIKFQSDRDNGKLCISQEGAIGFNLGRSSNAELVVRDGSTSAGTEIFTMDNSPKDWIAREVCTESRYLYFHLSKRDRSREIDINEINVNFKVLDIESRDRTLYLAMQFCDQKFELQNSSVHVKDLVPSSYWRSNEIKRQKLYCGLKFIKKKDDGKRTCFVYLPSPTRNCTYAWELVVSKIHGLIRTNYEFSLLCSDPRSRKVQIWCGDYTPPADQSHTTYTILINRTDTRSLNTSPNRLDFVASDHQGSMKDLLQKVCLTICSEGQTSAVCQDPDIASPYINVSLYTLCNVGGDEDDSGGDNSDANGGGGDNSDAHNGDGDNSDANGGDGDNSDANGGGGDNSDANDSEDDDSDANNGDDDNSDANDGDANDGDGKDGDDKDGDDVVEFMSDAQFVGVIIGIVTFVGLMIMLGVYLICNKKTPPGTRAGPTTPEAPPQEALPGTVDRKIPNGTKDDDVVIGRANN